MVYRLRIELDLVLAAKETFASAWLARASVLRYLLRVLVFVDYELLVVSFLETARQVCWLFAAHADLHAARLPSPHLVERELFGAYFFLKLLVGVHRTLLLHSLQLVEQRRPLREPPVRVVAVSIFYITIHA